MHSITYETMKKVFVNACRKLGRKIGSMLVRKRDHRQAVIGHEGDIGGITVRVALVENKPFVVNLTNKPSQSIACPGSAGYIDVGGVHPLQVGRSDQSRTIGRKATIERQQHPVSHL